MITKNTIIYEFIQLQTSGVDNRPYTSFSLICFFYLLNLTQNGTNFIKIIAIDSLHGIDLCIYLLIDLQFVRIANDGRQCTRRSGKPQSEYY